MKIRELFKSGNLVRSFEVFPPKRDGNVEGLFATIQELRSLQPDFISVTYGAGGSTREMTFDIARRIKDLGLTALVHLTCVGHSQAELGNLLDKLKQAGIENILALRGDPPKGQDRFIPAPDGFRWASELVAFIRSRWDFCVGVAGYPETHPEAKSPEDDLTALKRKAEAGADFITTQLFFQNDAYFDYVRKLRLMGVELPVLPGIMPLMDTARIVDGRFFGARVPAELLEGMKMVSSDPDMAGEMGIGYAVEQCRNLVLRGVPGLHLYTMNKAWASLAIYKGVTGK